MLLFLLLLLLRFSQFELRDNILLRGSVIFVVPITNAPVKNRMSAADTATWVADHPCQDVNHHGLHMVTIEINFYAETVTIYDCFEEKAKLRSNNTMIIAKVRLLVYCCGGVLNLRGSCAMSLCTQAHTPTHTSRHPLGRARMGCTETHTHTHTHTYAHIHANSHVHGDCVRCVLIIRHQ